jgi:hypothetical protein
MDVSIASMASSFDCLWKFFASMNRRTKQPEMDRRATLLSKGIRRFGTGIAEPGRERHSGTRHLTQSILADRPRALRPLRLSRKATVQRLSRWHNNDKKYPNAWLTATALGVSGRMRSGAPFAFMRRQIDLTIDAGVSPKSEEKSESGVSESLAHSL